MAEKKKGQRKLLDPNTMTKRQWQTRENREAHRVRGEFRAAAEAVQGIIREWEESQGPIWTSPDWTKRLLPVIEKLRQNARPKRPVRRRKRKKKASK